MIYEFTSKHTSQLIRSLIGIIHLFELQDVIKQSSELQTKEPIGYSNFPSFRAADITARLSTLPSLACTKKGLHTGFPLLIGPMVDFSFDDND